MSKRWQNGIYFSPHSKGKYIKLGPNDLSKKSIPKSERCEGFDELWNAVYNSVMEYWEFVPVDDISFFNQFESEEDNPGGLFKNAL